MNNIAIFSKITIVSDISIRNGLDHSIFNDQDITWSPPEDNIGISDADGVLLFIPGIVEKEKTLRSIEQSYGRPFFLIDMATFFESYYNVPPNTYDDPDIPKYIHLYGEKTSEFKSFMAASLKVWAEDYAVSNLLVKIRNTKKAGMNFSDIEYVISAAKYIKNKRLDEFTNMDFIPGKIEDITFSTIYLNCVSHGL